MRGLLPDFDTARPLGAGLPGLYQEEGIGQRFLAGLDEVLAPVFCTLDSIEAYFDPFLAPDDFVVWLAEWVGLNLDENWSLERRRAVVAQTVALSQWRGTARGLAAYVALYAGVEPEIDESGAIAWSPTPNAPVPGTADRRVTVRLRASDKAAFKRERIEAVVAAATPAHVTHRVEVVKG